jgi:hypothetical protein
MICFLQHHWSDVSAGSLIGVVSASLTARYVSGIISSPSSESTEEKALPRDVCLNDHAARNYDVENASSVPKHNNDIMLER